MCCILSHVLHCFPPSSCLLDGMNVPGSAAYSKCLTGEPLFPFRVGIEKEERGSGTRWRTTWGHYGLSPIVRHSARGDDPLPIIYQWCYNRFRTICSHKPPPTHPPPCAFLTGRFRFHGAPSLIVVPSPSPFKGPRVSFVVSDCDGVLLRYFHGANALCVADVTRREEGAGGSFLRNHRSAIALDADSSSQATCLLLFQVR